MPSSSREPSFYTANVVLSNSRGPQPAGIKLSYRVANAVLGRLRIPLLLFIFMFLFFMAPSLLSRRRRAFCPPLEPSARARVQISLRFRYFYAHQFDSV